MDLGLHAPVWTATNHYLELVGCRHLLNLSFSLINTQIRSAGEDAREALVRTSTRVQTLAAIHESVYGLGSLAEVKMHECIRRIAEHLRSVFDAVDVEFHIDARHVFNVETAMPLALIVNERYPTPFSMHFLKVEEP
ncbi:histidine kinase dimerization/phosphoacceptor domain -containing protein [Methanothermobacter sp.]|uniref:histidine kinase dimerization/phosphoacceptor domain -containing protein n=1 Tax=Methanothermobacter sp. TaxID=1884223 RepID=UPI0026385C02|nr:histidine kinase dimerization/phosphoacceptor domain -containing protein [Methanothermobacter sp.]MDI9617698.1 histidine kinase dimerization/phosphoacceptor domain -containing protein [Methanothermobacter sp.]